MDALGGLVLADLAVLDQDFVGRTALVARRRRDEKNEDHEPENRAQDHPH